MPPEETAGQGVARCGWEVVFTSISDEGYARTWRWGSGPPGVFALRPSTSPQQQCDRLLHSTLSMEGDEIDFSGIDEVRISLIR